MGIISCLLAEYQDSNPEKFNDELMHLKETDKCLDYINDICKALEVIPGITFLGSSIITDESKFKTRPYQEINISRLDLVNLKFRLEGKNEKQEIIQEDISVELFYPKFIDGNFYIYNDIRYYPILQLADKDTYVVGFKEKSLCLKTLLLPVVILYESCTIAGTTINGRKLFLKIFKKEVNILSYILAKKGSVTELLKFFQFDNDIELSTTPIDGMINFSIGKSFLATNETFLKKQNNIDFLCTLIPLLSGNKFKLGMPLEVESNFWISSLGKNFTTKPSSYEEKAEKILISFERILDARTKSSLMVSPSSKEDIYCVIRWLMKSYYALINKDNMDLVNKRLRLQEYIVNPLLRKFSDGTYRLLNDKLNSGSLSSLKSLFNISPLIIIKELIVNELLRYNGAANAIDIFNSILKVSCKGPQSIASKGEVPLRYRGLHPSYIGYVSLLAASAGDPGVTFTLTPFTKLEGFYFNDSKSDELDEIEEIEEE